MELDDPKKKLRTELRNRTGRPEEKIKNCDGAGLELPPLWFLN
jgi:hypothetical protein